MTIDRGPSPDFTKRARMVGWFDPRILALTGWQAAVAEVFGTYLDKREIESLLDANVEVRSVADEPFVGIDYVADVGDAFDPTYAIAWHLASGSVALTDDDGTDLELPRGEFLVMGGDEVYPAPSRERYRNQTVGPYGAAFPEPPADGRRPQMLALPGNHDWYDGLSSFLQQFCTASEIGGWHLSQGRSYFAIQLPNRWWLWAVDSGLGGHIDTPQKAYFERLAMEPGDRVILCWSTPAWTHVPNRPGDSRLLGRFVDEVVTRHHQAVVPLYLSGDSHHFAHYRSDDAEVHWVTAGGGGAFLHPTHHLQERITLADPDGPPPIQLTLQGDPWPDRRRSRRLLGRLLLFPRYNPSFLLFTATLHFALSWAVHLGIRDDDESLAEVLGRPTIGAVWAGFVRNPVAVLLAASVVAGFTAFAKPPREGARAYRLLGVVHGALHVAVALYLIRYVSGALDTIDQPSLFTLSFLLAISLLGGLASGVLVGLYLGLTNLLFRMHDNEAFSAFHHEGYKHFLRMRIDDTGLVVRVIGLESTGSTWQDVPAPSGVATAPPCHGADKVVPRLIRTIHIPTP